ncbi:SDR family oxidoreductase [uncultured Thiothrix sp.]|uniref:SDR family NAD(P)-dependent oxidoreductase n=1 Tax=uncultured Thiothrix sp. TaxID=223185 RepID=UPI0026357782|nr:SDR family NAD(P)-dependent oxidoreductase [uncultured Thiothrix sp.]
MVRTILITGASNGLGAALAQYYAAPDVHLALIGRDSGRLEQISATCKNLGAQVTTASINVTDQVALKHWLDEFDQQYPIDLAIANAGVTNMLSKQGSGEDLAAITQVLDTNLYGVIYTLHPLIERMRNRKKGQLAMISSLAAWRGMPITPSYCASKAAIKAWGEALRGWLAPEGVKVNVICPGFVKTDLSDQFPGTRPTMISAEQAAPIIAKGLARNQAVIAFPFPLTWGMWFVSVLPFPLASYFLGLFGYNRPGSPRKAH